MSENNWFVSKKPSSSKLLIFAFVPTVNIAFLFGAYDAVKTSGNTEVILYIIQGIIGLAFGITFFAPLWSSLPVSTENDFLNFRYSGKFVMPLKNTRSVLIGVFVIPLLISLVIKTPLELLDKFQFSNQWIFLIVFSALTIYGLKNSIRQRIIFDSIAGISLAILCLIALVLLAFFPEIDSLKIFFHLNTLSSSNIIMAGLITWWFANIVDLPDMRAQKLLSAQSSKAGYYSFLVGNGIVMIIQGIFICIYAIFKSNSYPLVDCICISALFISGCAQLMNLQHWSGNLMHGLFQKSISNLRLRNFIPMLISIGTAYFICFLTDSIFEIIQGILFFSAGVGPVYVLRWFYFRINAITQLTAMLSSLLLGIIYISLNFSGFFNQHSNFCPRLNQLPNMGKRHAS